MTISKIGLIAGSGQFPLIFAKAARARQIEIYAAAYNNEADPQLEQYVDTLQWVYVGQISRLIKFFKRHGVRRAVMMGGIEKAGLFTHIRPDIKAVTLLAGMRHTHDDNVLRAFAAALEKEGIQIEPSTFLLPELLAPSGCWTRRKPNRSQQKDIELGWQLAKEVGRLDIGQCLVVGGGSVLAVEAIDGTDATIQRGAALGRDQAVVVKVCKPEQDVRFDIPAVGTETIRTMQTAGARVLVVEAGKTVVFDRAEMIALANRAKIAIVAMGDESAAVATAKSESAADNIHTTDNASESKPPPAATGAAASVVSPGPKLRLGVVGVGYLGQFHAQKYARMPDVELVGVADPDRERADEIAEGNQTRAFYDHRDLIERVDAVSIAAPTPLHFDISRDFLERGRHVLIEKPMTTTLEQADTLIRMAADRGLIIQVGHLERFNPAVVALDGVVKEPLFIESHRLSMYKDRCVDVGVVHDLMIHDIDLILNFVNSEIETIHAAGSPVITPYVDIANARLQFANGCVANITASRISMKNQRKIRLFQKDAYISMDFAEHNVTLVRQNAEDSVPENGSISAMASNLDIGRDLKDLIPGMEISNIRLSKGDALDDELKSFVASVADGTPPAVSGRMGRDALKIALEIMEQIDSHRQNHYPVDNDACRVPV